MHHYASQLVDLLLVLVAAWMVLAIIFFIYAYFAGLKYPVSESVFGRVIVISFFIITMSIWLPIVVGALILSLIGYLWSRFRVKLAGGSSRGEVQFLTSSPEPDGAQTLPTSAVTKTGHSAKARNTSAGGA